MSAYIYIAVMAGTTYLIRMIPLVFFRKEIKNRFIRSFLTYVPCVCLTAMTFPAILYATNTVVSGTVALAVAIVAALWRRNLVTVAALSCIAVFVTEWLMQTL
ncbi:MAG: AzlD domain-containing protein [Clostridia bacterium]|nr:AzlD domain-containing protein [Clostridia bacterium]